MRHFKMFNSFLVAPARLSLEFWLCCGSEGYSYIVWGFGPFWWFLALDIVIFITDAFTHLHKKQAKSVFNYKIYSWITRNRIMKEKQRWRKETWVKKLLAFQNESSSHHKSEQTTNRASATPCSVPTTLDKSPSGEKLTSNTLKVKRI